METLRELKVQGHNLTLEGQIIQAIPLGAPTVLIIDDPRTNLDFSKQMNAQVRKKRMNARYDCFISAAAEAARTLKRSQANAYVLGDSEMRVPLGNGERRVHVLVKTVQYYHALLPE